MANDPRLLACDGRYGLSSRITLSRFARPRPDLIRASRRRRSPAVCLDLIPGDARVKPAHDAELAVKTSAHDLPAVAVLARDGGRVGGGGLLAQLDNAAADRPGAGEQGEQPVAVAVANPAAGKAVTSLLKRPSASSTACLLLRNTSRHIVGSDAAMRVKSRNPPAENSTTSERVASSRSEAVPTML